MTAAIVAPICGIRSKNPVMTASTIGNGRPSAQADRPATIAATHEIATLPTSELETARMHSSSTGCQRRSTAGGVKPNSQSVIVGRSINKNNARKVKVTSERIEPNAPPAMPRIVVAASGSPAARSFSALRIVSSTPAGRDELLEAVGLGELVPVGGQLVDEVGDLVPQRAGGDHDDGDDREKERGEGRQRGAAAPPAAGDERAHRRVEAQRQHGRDEDRQQRARREDRQRHEGARTRRRSPACAGG